MSEVLQLNDILKSPTTAAENSQRIRGHQIPYTYLFSGVPSVVEPTAQSWQSVDTTQPLPNVQFLTIGRKGVETSQEDGARIEIPPRSFTPIQFVKNDQQVFSEIPWSGKLAFLTVSPKGEFSIQYFDVPELSDSLLKGYVTKGWIMTWFSLEEQKKAYVLEYEKPGFTDKDLLTVPDQASEFMGTPIPAIFWQTIEKLKKGYSPDSL